MVPDIENKMVHTTGLVKQKDRTKITEIENKIQDSTNVVTLTNFNTKVTYCDLKQITKCC